MMFFFELKIAQLLSIFITRHDDLTKRKKELGKKKGLIGKKSLFMRI